MELFEINDIIAASQQGYDSLFGVMQGIALFKGLKVVIDLDSLVPRFERNTEIKCPNCNSKNYIIHKVIDYCEGSIKPHETEYCCKDCGQVFYN